MCRTFTQVFVIGLFAAMTLSRSLPCSAAATAAAPQTANSANNAGSANAAAPKPIDRRLNLVLTVDASQSWRNEKQWSRATSQQRYEIATQLRSDGRLYADNLLDPDLDQRMHIKSEYYTYKGLVQLRQDFGGRLPSYEEVAQHQQPDAPRQGMSCVQGADCPSAIAERFAAISALQNNAKSDLEQFIEAYEAPGGHWLYFTSYAGCPNRLRLSHHAHFEGEQAFDRDHKNLQPFQVDWTADSSGSAEEQSGLCQRYLATVDTRSGEVFVENAFIPAAHGDWTTRIAGTPTHRDADLPVPYEVLRWTNDLLRRNRDSGSQQATLRITQPLDGNATVLGAFDGTAKVGLQWSFTTPAPTPAAK